MFQASAVGSPVRPEIAVSGELVIPWLAFWRKALQQFGGVYFVSPYFWEGEEQE